MLLVAVIVRLATAPVFGAVIIALYICAFGSILCCFEVGSSIKICVRVLSTNFGFMWISINELVLRKIPQKWHPTNPEHRAFDQHLVLSMNTNIKDEGVLLFILFWTPSKLWKIFSKKRGLQTVSELTSSYCWVKLYSNNRYTIGGRLLFMMLAGVLATSLGDIYGYVVCSLVTEVWHRQWCKYL